MESSLVTPHWPQHLTFFVYITTFGSKLSAGSLFNCLYIIQFQQKSQISNWKKLYKKKSKDDFDHKEQPEELKFLKKMKISKLCINCNHNCLLPTRTSLQFWIFLFKFSTCTTKTKIYLFVLSVRSTIEIWNLILMKWRINFKI